MGKDVSRKMVVTDVSLCEFERSLGCLAAVRPLIIDLSTTGKIGGDKCNIKSRENPSARIGDQNGISASFPMAGTEGKPASRIDIEFRKGSALVKLNRTEVLLLLVIRLWDWQGKHSSEPSSIAKMAIGCFCFGARLSCADGRRLAGRRGRGELALAGRIFRPCRSRRVLRMADRVVAGVAGRTGAHGLPDDGVVARHELYRKCDGRLAWRVLERYGSREFLFLDGRARRGCRRDRCSPHTTAQIDCRSPGHRVAQHRIIGAWQWPGGSGPVAAGKAAKLVGSRSCRAATATAGSPQSADIPISRH